MVLWLLDKEADELTSVEKYERTKAHQGYHSGHYSRKLTTMSGDVKMKIQDVWLRFCSSKKQLFSLLI